MSVIAATSAGATPGFQGYERSDVQVVIYPQGQDVPVSLTGALYAQPSGRYDAQGRSERGATPTVTSVQVAKSMGQAGSFTVALKVPPGAPDPASVLSDDDWVDISLVRQGRKTHVLRGLIDEIRRNVQVVGGAQVTTWTITGRDFQKVYEESSTYLSLYTGEASAAFLAYQWDLANSTGQVADTVSYFLKHWLEVTASVGRNLWTVPANIPGMPSSFPASAVADVSSYTNSPPRFSRDTSLVNPQGFVWDLAQEWSDPTFCELFTELRPKASAATQVVAGGAAVDVTPADTEMAYVVRDRPFILVAPELSRLGYPTGTMSPWFSLPTVTIPVSHVASSDLGRNGQERFNLFMVNPTLLTDQMTQLAEVNRPLWHKPDMSVHGVRRYDVVTRYQAGFFDRNTEVTSADVAERLRYIARDYHCMDPYWLSGTIAFARGVPELRCGQRLRIANRSENDQETYYVEGVSHTFTPGSGLRTSVAVTRGYVGSDAAIVSTMQDVIAGYTLAPPGPGAP